MTTECRSSNDDKSRVIRDSLHRYIATYGATVLRFNAAQPFSFAWHAVASREGECFVIPTAI